MTYDPRQAAIGCHEHNSQLYIAYSDIMNSIT